MIAGFGIPFRHLVEGGFGYLNLILALFAGAFFGQVLQRSGAADAMADMTAASQRRLIPLIIAGVPLFLTGMLIMFYNVLKTIGSKSPVSVPVAAPAV